MNVFFTIEKDIGIIKFDLSEAKVNLLTFAVMKELAVILNEAADNSRLKALVFISGKKDVFIAGADIKEIENISRPEEGKEKSQTGQNILNKIEDFTIPTIAVIDGVALGGGCELALSCRYRIATFNERIKIGLPEVNLGIIPGFGGTYRLPRLVGLSQALELILKGKILTSREALRIGLLDRLFPQAGLENAWREFIAEVQGTTKRETHFQKRQNNLVARFLDKNSVGQTILFSQAKSNVIRSVGKFYPAALKAIDVIQQTAEKARTEALAIEAEEFSKLAITDVSKNLIKVFYLTERYKKAVPPDCNSITAAVIHKCGLIGAGVMGGGIAQLLTYYDISVRIKDINYQAIAKGLQAAFHVFQQAVKRKKLSLSDAQMKMAKISTTTSWNGFQNVDCVIEAVVEDMTVKKKIFQELSQFAPPRAILCTNTSALSVTEMAKAAQDPSRVIGLHFFNPVHRMPLIEIVKTEMSSKETLVTAFELAKRLGKTPILVRDTPGFLVNRILLTSINEAGRLLDEGVPVEVIDKSMTDFGMPMGPLTLADEVGLDVGIKALHILYAGLGERFKPVDLFEKIYKQGWFGKKTGKGFYLHQEGKRPNPLFASITQEKKMSPTDGEEYRRRMLFIMINEAARCLEDEIVSEPATVDVGMLLGTGFPAFRGGLLRYADTLGIDNVVEILGSLESKQMSGHFQPCAYLMDLKNKKRGFYS